MIRWRGGPPMAFSAALLLAACGPAATTSEPTPPTPEPSQWQTLPDADQLLPSGVVGSPPWIRMSSMPNDFDPDLLHASPADLADAFGAAVHAAWAGSADRPDLELDVFAETSERAVLVISEIGLGDDSVAGSQYALVAIAEGGSWRLEELWTRALCRRGVSGELCV